MKIVFISQYSVSPVREKLHLQNWCTRNLICRLLNHPLWAYQDYAIWVDDFITEFKKYTDKHEFHIVSPHIGMKKVTESFMMDGIHYHFFKKGGSLMSEYIDEKCGVLERNDYQRYGRRAGKIIDSISPDCIILCGAENPEYGSAVFHVDPGIPVYLIPQTFLNDPKRIAMKVASRYRTIFERKVFSRVDFISTASPDMASFARSVNPDVKVRYVGFPTHKPEYRSDIQTKYDFVFFARFVVSYKGIEDVIKALSVVKQSHPDVTLAVIGGFESNAYKDYLNLLITESGLSDNISFLGSFPTLTELYENVQKGKIAVLPGITASLNCTVREAMSLGVPPVVYETKATDRINSQIDNICCAAMSDFTSLAEKMLMMLRNTDIYSSYLENGRRYAEQFFDNSPIVSSLLAELGE